MTDSTFDEAAFRSRLLSLQAETEALIKISEDSRKPVELDQASVGRLSRMDAMQQQAMAMATQRQRQNDLHRIRAALRRIEEGEYGYCIGCGGVIAAARLELDPATPTCIHCAVNRK